VLSFLDTAVSSQLKRRSTPVRRLFNWFFLNFLLETLHQILSNTSAKTLTRILPDSGRVHSPSLSGRG